MLPFAAFPLLWLAVSPQNFEMRLPPGMAPGTVTGRYQIAGSAGVHDGFIDSLTIPVNSAVSGIKGVLYAPGCQIETFSVVLPAQREPEYKFQCRPLRTISVDARIEDYSYVDTAPRYEVEVVYAAYWAHDLFGNDGDPVVTTLPVARSPVGSSGQFRIDLPELAADPIAGDSGRPGALQFHVRDVASGRAIGTLVPVQQTARMGGLRIGASYPKELSFQACMEPAGQLAKRFVDRGCDRITH